MCVCVCVCVCACVRVIRWCLWWLVTVATPRILATKLSRKSPPPAPDKYFCSKSRKLIRYSKWTQRRPYPRRPRRNISLLFFSPPSFPFLPLPRFKRGSRYHPRENLGIKDGRRWVLERHKHQLIYLPCFFLLQCAYFPLKQTINKFPP